MKRKIEKQFSNEDFEKASRLDKIYIAIRQPEFVLSNRDNEYLDILTRTYPIICKGKSREETIDLIAQLEPNKWDKQIVNIIKDAQSLFGNFEQLNKIVLRHIVTEKLKYVAQKMENIIDDDEIAASERVKASQVFANTWAKIGAINKLEEEESEEKEVEMPQISITLNPKYLESINNKT